MLLAYLSAEALTSCPHPVLINHGPDPVRYGQQEVPAGTTAAMPANTAAITVDSAAYSKSDVAYPFDLGFRCSDAAPELRQKYPFFSWLVLGTDASAPSGLSIEVRKLGARQ